MADNLLWVEKRGHRGKVLLFAHDLHVQTGVEVSGSPGNPAVGHGGVYNLPAATYARPRVRT